MKLYRIFDNTIQKYVRTNMGKKFYMNKTGAELGIRRLKESMFKKDHELELRSYVPLPEQFIDSLIKWIEEADNESITGDIDREDLLKALKEYNKT